MHLFKNNKVTCIWLQHATLDVEAQNNVCRLLMMSLFFQLLVKVDSQMFCMCVKLWQEETFRKRSGGTETFPLFLSQGFTWR